MNILAKALVSTLFLYSAESAFAETLPLVVDLQPGQFLAIDFEFTAQPTGADVLMTNGGAVSNGLLGSYALLFHDGELVASWANLMLNTFSIFSTPDSPYGAWGTKVDLSAVFGGGASRLELHPVFATEAPGAHVSYNLTAFGAAQATGFGSLTDQVIAPEVFSVQAVPLPAAGALFALSQLGVIALTVRRRQASVS